MSVRNTQGPWTAVEYPSGDCWQIQYGTRGNWIAEVAIDGDEVSAEADARLIAAAPELLEAVRQVMGWIDGWNPNFINHPEWPEVAHHVRAAIARATGEAQ